MRRLSKISAAFILTALLLAGCGGLPVEKVPLSDAPAAPQDAQPSPIGFNKIVFAVPTGTPTRSTSPKGPLGLLVCDWPYGMQQGGLRGRGFPSDDWREIFFQTMEGLGYDVAGNPGRLFDEAEDLQRSLYVVGGRITDVKIDMCQRSSIWGIDQGVTGEGGLTVEWSVFDVLRQRTALKFTTKGYGRLRYPNHEGMLLLFEEALAAAIHNLGAHREFFDLVFYGTEPADLPSFYEDPYEDPIGLYDPQETVNIPRRALSTIPAQTSFARLSQTAVMIQTAGGHGSGFFITDQGHILTNAHVVGNAQRVRIVTSGKKEKIPAEVLRLDRKRDVALLKLESFPDDLAIITLPIRPDKPEVGEDVYAIGAPAYKQLQDTMTKGIVSAHRFDRRRKQWEIQADVYIYGGNSGGPLVDKGGNVVGIAVSGYTDGDQALSGLNNFIPIMDALEKLDILYSD